MLDKTFASLYDAVVGITLRSFLICIGAALVLGVVMALVYCIRTTHSRSFTVTLALLPATVAAVIMMVNGNLGAGVAVAGAFSLVRFRSTPGTAKEIGAIFLAMAVGLACGMGYPGFGAIFAGIMCVATVVLSLINFGGQRHAAQRRVLKITVPEDLDYPTVFDDLFEQYAVDTTLVSVRTTNLGSLNRLTYELTIRKAGTEKAFIDALRCRNGNLEISMSMQAMDNREML
ncbi:MAG: DUF4956 domain-containing protein [Ruminococcaceae bacterium]|nr:DUF4956 domain-containing protein [Oscillospiraceae bacterium]MBQ3214889.1 DUF4956 domain-containing protein [Oscillospiraceae bacterium]